MPRLFLPILLLYTVIACDKQDSQSLNTGLRAEYADHPCCANLSLLDGTSIAEFDNSRKDFLLYAVNMDHFVTSEALSPGDVVQIDVKVLDRPLDEELAVNCTSICNRANGILVNIIRLQKE